MMRKRYRLSTYRDLLRMGLNGTLHLMARVLPGGLNLRPFLHRLRGVKIYGRVFIGDDVYLDEDFPETLEIHDGVVIGPRCTIVGHTRGTGRIIIEKQVAIAAGCVIVCAKGQTLTIGEGAVISAGSTVSNDVPPYTLCGAPRIKIFGKINAPFTLETSYDEFRRGVEPIRAKDGVTHSSAEPRPEASSPASEVG